MIIVKNASKMALFYFCGLKKWPVSGQGNSQFGNGQFSIWDRVFFNSGRSKIEKHYVPN